MPFTPTHVLAVVPIARAGRGRLPFSALAIGSMIPDVPLFVSVGPSYATTHSAVGLVTACLPLGLLGSLLFQRVWKRPLFAMLPAFVQQRVVGYAAPRVSLSLAVALALVLGAATHVVWDSFTHEGRWGTRHVPWLEGTAFTVGGRGVPGYKAAQYGCTLVGLPLLAGLGAVWLRRQDPRPTDGWPTLSRRAKATVAVLAIVVCAAAAWLGGFAEGGLPNHRLGRSVITSGLALVILTTAYGLAFHAAEATRRRAG